MFRILSKELLSKHCSFDRNVLRNISTTTALAKTRTSKSPVNYTMKDCFRYSTEEGYVRTSSYDPIDILNITIDKYVWEHVNKWQNKTAIVSANMLKNDWIYGNFELLNHPFNLCLL